MEKNIQQNESTRDRLIFLEDEIIRLRAEIALLQQLREENHK